MKKPVKLLALIFIIALLCGCDKLFGGMKLTESTEKWIDFAYDVPVKQGYYLSEDDDSYIVIENDRFTLVGVDWESHYREIYPRLENQTESEYDEEVSEEIQYTYTNLYVNQPYIPIRYTNRPEGFYNPYLILVTNTTEEAIMSGEPNYKGARMEMPDENTIECTTIDFPHNYIYCGASLPKGE